MNKSHLIFLKLGGSLITDKAKPLTPQLDVIQRVSAEISQACRDDPQLQLLIGHGSGSFGHAVADRYQTQSGVEGDRAWQGFIEVWAAARELNQIMINRLAAAGLPVIAFPPSAGIIAENKMLESWDTRPLETALAHRLIPVVYGDVVFDTAIGGTIFSTEQIFQHLAKVCQPKRILLAGLESGVYLNPQQSQEIIKHITPQNIDQVQHALSGSKNTDVTGGMLTKVQFMLSLVQEIPSLEILIFSGVNPGRIQEAIKGGNPGTLITA